MEGITLVVPFHRQMANPVRLVAPVQVKLVEVALMEMAAPAGRATVRTEEEEAASIQAEQMDSIVQIHMEEVLSMKMPLVVEHVT